MQRVALHFPATICEFALQITLRASGREKLCTYFIGRLESKIPVRIMIVNFSKSAHFYIMLYNGLCPESFIRYYKSEIFLKDRNQD